jgi:hypothetical protein
MLKRFGVLLGLAAGMAGGMLEARGADTAPLIEAIRGVDSEGKGAKAAAQAFQKLSQEGPTAIPSLLTAMDGANPLASNYLRNAVESIVAKTRKAKGSLPLAEIEAFLKDTKHEPRARRLAFEILVATDKANYDRLVPGMLNDPSTELRRDAVIQVMEQGNALFDDDKKDEAKAKYREAMAAARDDDQVKTLKKYLEELGDKVDLPTHFGFLMTWKLIAPFDNTAGKGIAVAYPPAKEHDFGKEYEGKEGVKASWVGTTTEDEYGIVDLAKVLTPFKGSVAYAVAEFDSDAEKAVDLRLGTPNSWKVWLNGKLLFAREEYHRGMNLDQYRMRGTLKKGKNTILVKVCQNEQTEEWAQRWQIQLRVCDATGTAVLSADRKAAASTGGSD